MSKVRFIINSIEEEKVICENTLENIDFFNKYRIIFTLPKKSIEEEYDIKRYNEFIAFLEKCWNEKDEESIDKLLVFFNKPRDTEFIVRISNYGVLGSYSDNQNIITINCYMKDIDFDPIRVIKHEITHILVQPFVEAYSIEHEKKELIVNSVLEMMND